MLFVTYINDMPECIQSAIYLFADDTKIYHKIKPKEDKDIPQDLNYLQEGSRKWLMPFHPQKCTCMNMHGGYRQTRDTEYYMERRGEGELAVEKILKEKDFGVLTDGQLIFGGHNQEKVKKSQ